VLDFVYPAIDERDWSNPLVGVVLCLGGDKYSFAEFNFVLENGDTSSYPMGTKNL